MSLCIILINRDDIITAASKYFGLFLAFSKKQYLLFCRDRSIILTEQSVGSFNSFNLKNNQIVHRDTIRFYYHIKALKDKVKLSDSSVGF
jgi:hypothetical protein